MKKQLMSILQDIKEGENIENYLLILAALVIAILSLFNITDDNIFESAILAVLSLVIFGQIKSDRLLRSIKQASEIKGISAFYSDRQNVPPIEDRILTAHKEVAIMGLQLSTITHSYLPLLKQQAQIGCQIKLLLMSPTDDKGNPLPWVDEVGKIHTFLGLKGILNINIVQLTNWFEELPIDVQKRIEIKLYSTIPSGSILLIDKDLETGSIKVEPILYKFPPAERPSFIVTRSSSPGLYKNLLDSFNDLWNKGFNLGKQS